MRASDIVAMYHEPSYRILAKYCNVLRRLERLGLVESRRATRWNGYSKRKVGARARGGSQPSRAYLEFRIVPGMTAPSLADAVNIGLSKVLPPSACCVVGAIEAVRRGGLNATVTSIIKLLKHGTVTHERRPVTLKLRRDVARIIAGLEADGRVVRVPMAHGNFHYTLTGSGRRLLRAECPPDSCPIGRYMACPCSGRSSSHMASS